MPIENEVVLRYNSSSRSLLMPRLLMPRLSMPRLSMPRLLMPNRLTWTQWICRLVFRR